MKKIKTFYLNLKLRNKILVVELVTSLIPMFLLGIVGYHQLSQLLYDREKERVQETLDQSSLTLDYKLSTYTNSLNRILIDYKLPEDLSYSFSNNYEMYSFYKNTLNPLFNNILALNSDIEEVILYTDLPIFSDNHFLMSVADIETKDWFKQTIDSSQTISHLSYDPERIHFSTKLFTRDKNSKNIIDLSVNYEALFGFLEKLFEDQYGAFIVDENNQPIFQYQSSDDSMASLLSKQSISNILEDKQELNRRFVHLSEPIPNSQWRIVLVRPKAAITKSIKAITITYFTIILISLFLLIFLVYSTSRAIVKPLENLTLNMANLDFDNFDVSITSETNDEINTLIIIFKKMTKRIKTLINEVYVSTIEKQDFEFKALQSQINPHFFYNSLSMINSKAILNDQPEISQMAQLLSTFYRTTLNKSNGIITVEEELKNVRSYLEIQQLMHQHSFEYFLNIENNILENQILNLTLQPLIENAILHGLDHKEGMKKMVIIEGKEKQDKVIFTISDNGAGMSEDQLSLLLTKETTGYGVYNINKRIQLIFGEIYGLDYHSFLYKGTTVTVTLPRTDLPKTFHKDNDS